MTHVLFTDIANSVFTSLKTTSNFVVVRNVIPSNHTIEYDDVDVDLIYRTESSGNITFVTGTTNTALVGYVAQPGDTIVLNGGLTSIGDKVILETDNTSTDSMSISFTSNVTSYQHEKVVVDGSYDLPANSYGIVVEGTLTIPTSNGNQEVSSANDINIVYPQANTQTITGTGKLLKITIE